MPKSQKGFLGCSIYILIKTTVRKQWAIPIHSYFLKKREETGRGELYPYPATASMKKTQN